MQLESTTDLDPILPQELLEKRVAYVVNLSAIKANSGALWEKLSKGVLLRLEKILARVLTPSDCFAAIDEIRYMIATPALESAEAVIVTVRIACELTFEILGHCDVEQLRIEQVIGREKKTLTTVLLPVEEVSKLVEKAHPAGVGGLSTRRPLSSEPTRSQIVTTDERTGLTISHHFLPVWDIRHEAITTYFCVPEKILSKNDGSEVGCSRLTLKERSVVELSCILTGVGYLSEFVELGERFVLGLCVGFETLCSPVGRMEFVRVCRGLPAAYRPYLFFLLADVPLGVTQSRLSDLASLICPFGRAAASVAGGCRNCNAYQGHGFSALAMDFSTAGQSNRITADIVHVAAAARNARLGSLAFGLSDIQLVNQACTADIQMLQGSAIAPATSKPKRMTRLTRASVLGVEEKAAEKWF